MNLITPIVVVPECAHCGSADVRSCAGPRTLTIDEKVRGHLVTRWRCGECGKRTIYRVKQERAGREPATERAS